MREFKGYVHGVDLGGWISQCPPTMEHYKEFIKEEDFANIASWGLDHVRIPVDYELLEDDKGNPREGGMEILKNAVSWAGKYGLNVVIDLHKTPGYSFDWDENKVGFFDSPELQDRFYKLWDRIAFEFKDLSDRVAYELLNEVTEPKYSPVWNDIAENCIKRIRTVAPNTYILVGSYWNNSISALPDLREPYDDKIVYNFHCYEPLLFTHQGASWVKDMAPDFRCEFTETEEFFEKMVEGAVKLAEERKVPLYCGEYGVINLADVNETLKWYKTFLSVLDKYKIGRAAWSYKSMSFGLIDDHMKPIFEEVKKLL